MESKIVKTTIGATILIILLATLLIPICNDITDQSVAKYNNSEGHYALASAESEVILDYSIVEGVQVWKVNGIAVDGPASELLFITNNKALVAGSADATFLGSGFGRQDHVTSMHLVVGDNHAEGTLTTTSLSFNPSFDYDWCLFVSPTGNYRSIAASSESTEVYVGSAADLYYANWNYTLGTWFSGTGEAVTLGNNAPATVSATLNSIPGVEGVYSVSIGNNAEDFGFIADNSGTPYTTHPAYYIVPASVVGEKIDGGLAISGIISVIPLIIIMAILLFVVGSVITKRD